MPYDLLAVVAHSSDIMTQHLLYDGPYPYKPDSCHGGGGGVEDILYPRVRAKCTSVVRFSVGLVARPSIGRFVRNRRGDSGIADYMALVIATDYRLVAA